GSRSLTRSPLKYSPPSSIELKPAIMRKRVVFPHPEGPKRVKNSPAWISSDSPGITVLFPYRFTASLMDISILTSLYLAYRSYRPAGPTLAPSPRRNALGGLKLTHSSLVSNRPRQPNFAFAACNRWENPDKESVNLTLTVM